MWDILNYEDIALKYDKLEGIKDYKIYSAEHIKKLFGYDVEKVKGYPRDERASKLWLAIHCNFINGHGLTAREKIGAVKLIKIDNKKQRFETHFKNGEFAYYYYNGSIG